MIASLTLLLTGFANDVRSFPTFTSTAFTTPLKRIKRLYQNVPIG